MKVCPRCRGEYLEHIEICYSCKEPVLGLDEVHTKASDALLSKEELLREVTVPLMEGGLVQCREVEKILQRAKISSAVYPVNVGCNDHNAALGTGCSMKYMLLVRESDLDACKAALEGRFSEQVDKEGLGGKFSNDVIDLSAAEIECPACGERGALKEGECASCGLFLGEQTP